MSWPGQIILIPCLVTGLSTLLRSFTLNFAPCNTLSSSLRTSLTDEGNSALRSSLENYKRGDEEGFIDMNTRNDTASRTRSHWGSDKARTLKSWDRTSRFWLFQGRLSGKKYFLLRFSGSEVLFLFSCSRIDAVNWLRKSAKNVSVMIDTISRTNHFAEEVHQVRSRHRIVGLYYFLRETEHLGSCLRHLKLDC